jgi:hypothetical protein
VQVELLCVGVNLKVEKVVVGGLCRDSGRAKLAGTLQFEVN